MQQPNPKLNLAKNGPLPLVSSNTQNGSKNDHILISQLKSTTYTPALYEEEFTQITELPGITHFI